MKTGSRCNLVARSFLIASSIALAVATPVRAQDTPASPPLPAWVGESIVEVPVDELTIRLVPLDLATLEVIRADVMDRVRVNATELADAMVARLRLTEAGMEAGPDIDAVGERTIYLLIGKQRLVARAAVVVDAIEAKGGDVDSDRAYLDVILGLRPDLAAMVGQEPPAADVAAAAGGSDETITARVAELVAMVGAERPVHERDAPWSVSVAELELELQPLTTEQVLERLDAWQDLLQREVRERVRMDILLNDSAKLERNVEVRNEAAALVGVAAEEISLSELKAALARQVEAQQQIITAITDRMKAAIEIVRRRGGDAQAYIDYIASATGRRLNFTDFSVLRVQVLQWLNSPTGGRMIARKVLLFAGVVALFWVVSRLLRLLTLVASRRVRRSSTLLGPVLAGIVEKTTLVVGVVMAASAVGVNTGPLLAMIGATGLVIGLALQGTLSNFASGILILLNRPFDVGDVVDAGGVFGKVDAMNLVSTTILTFDNQLMLVPNNQIWNSVITNVTGKDTRRVDLTFGIAYSSDIAKATDILEELLTAHPKTLDDPAPVVRVHELADSSVNLIARPWVRTVDYWDVHWDLMRQVKERFDRDGVDIPFPQRDLHLPGTIEVTLAGSRAAPTGGASRDDNHAVQGLGGRPVREPGPAVAEAGRAADADNRMDGEAGSN